MARLIAVHFWPALAVISRATSLMNSSNSAESGSTRLSQQRQIQGIRFHVERNGVGNHIGVGFQFPSGARGPGKGYDVLFHQVVEQVSGAAAD